MAMDETASPQRSTDVDPVTAKLLAAHEAEISSLRQLLDARTAELAARNSAYGERIEQQSATIDVLKAMSALASDTQPVFELITTRARELCGSLASMLFEFDRELLHLRAWGGYDADAANDYLRQFPMRPDRGTAVGRVILERNIVHIRNISEDPEIAQSVRTMGVRSTLGIPLLRDGQPIGVIAIGSATTGGFSDSQVELLKTFAEQAVIAIGSAETFRALQHRTAELAARNSAYGEKIEHQSATIDVLKAMSKSPGDAQPVFDQIVRRARELCEANAAGIFEFDGRLLHFKTASHDPAAPAEYHASAVAHLAEYPMVPRMDTAAGRAIIEREIVNLRVADDANLHASVLSMGITHIVVLPLLRDGNSVGTIALNTRKPTGFSESQVALLKTFAEQAVIAIRSAETYRALQTRTSELQDSLEEQTGTSDVLKVISGSGFALERAFQAVVDTAVRLCRADQAGIFRLQDDAFCWVAGTAMVPEHERRVRTSRIRPGTGTLIGRVALQGRPVQILDAWTDPLLAPGPKDSARISGSRTLLGVPLLRDGVTIGAIGLGRLRVEPFTERQINLVATFADQAVIAIENTRLLTEQREALEHQTATAEVLQVVNANPGNLAPVFDAILEKAHGLCGAPCGSLQVFENGQLRAVATRGMGEPFSEILRRGVAVSTIRLHRLQDQNEAIQIADLAEAARAMPDEPTLRSAVELAGIRTFLSVPLRKDDTFLGRIVAARQEVRPFSENQIALLQSFAAQAVIAMDNARLLTEQREALEQQTATAEVLQVINSNPGDPTPAFDAILERVLRLCDSSFGSLETYDGEFTTMVAGRLAGPTTVFPVGGRFRVDPGTLMHRIVLGEDIVSLADIKDDDAYRAGVPVRVAIVDVYGARSQLMAGLRKDGRLLGLINIFRKEVRPFTEAQIAIVKGFATQAVIAMENARLLSEQRESLEQQTATAEVLKVISRSAFDLQTVLNTLIESAVRLCNASRGEVFLRDGDLFRVQAHAGSHLPELLDFLQRNPINIGRETVTGRVAMTGEVHNIADIVEDKEYEFPGVMEHRALRSRLGVPLVRDGRVEGVLHLSREESQPFTPRQVELVRTFADQAVIALENARLFSAVQDRTRELTESLEQQTATADVLKVISRSAFDLQSVLDTLIESATRLCSARQGFIDLRDGDIFTVRAASGVSASLLQFARENPHRIGSKSAVGRVATTAAVVNIADFTQDPDYDYPGVLDHLSFRSVIGAPLLRDGRVEGVISLTRPQAEPFSPRQVELLATFADQAVIALENARLFGAVEARTGELAQSVAELQALEEVLRAVNSSLDLQTVLSTIISRAVPLAQADEGMIYEFDPAEEVFVPKAAYGMSDERIARLRDRRIRIGETFLGRSAAQRMPIRIDDVQQDQSTSEARELLQGIHAVLAIPLLREDKVIGGLVIRRRSEGAFEEATVKLLQTFATQSVLAIANARLFDEVQARTKELTESLEIQSATADVLKAISRSAFDLDTVLDTLTRSAATLCGAATGVIILRDGDHFRHRTTVGHSPALRRWRESNPLRPGRDSTSGRVLLSRSVEQIIDVQADPELNPSLKTLSSNRTSLGVPLLRGTNLEGAFILGRTRVEAFSQRQIELVQTFADQALIAIENARLFNEVQARTRELAKSLDDLRTAQDRLIQTEKLASLGQLTAGIAHEIKNPLNFVNNFSALSVDLIDELNTALTCAPLDATVRTEVKEVTDLLRGNLEKVVQHGKRADGIVKNMLLHARESGGERRSVDLNATVDEALNLAYHGARAEKPGFTITLERNFDPAVGSVELYPQEFTRVMLNIISNGFYAATKARDAAAPDFQPTLAVATEARPDAVLIRVRDNGTGIPDCARARLFEPFFTTKPAGEGTGLGLSLSHDIVVKQHNGSIAVDSRLGEYTEFTIRLPRTSDGAPA
jgi:GAF domain-containing protein